MAAPYFGCSAPFPSLSHWSENWGPLQSYDRAIAHGEQSHHDRLVTEAWIDLVRIQGGLLKRTADAHRSALVAEARLTRQPGTTLMVHYQTALGITLFHEGRYREAGEAFAKSLELLGPLTDENEAAYALALGNVGRAQSAQGKFSEALTAHQQALEIDRRLRGNHDPLTAFQINHLANTHMSVHHHQQALDLYLEALAIEEQVFGPDHLTIVFSTGNVCDALSLLKRHVEALTMCRRAVLVAEKLPNRADLATALTQLAGAYLDAGEFDAADETYRRALIAHEATLGLEHLGLAYDLVGLGRVSLAKKRPAEAVAPLERALQLRTHGSGDPLDTAEAELLLAEALLDGKVDLQRGETHLRHVKNTISGGGEAAADLLDELTKWEAARKRHD